MQVVLVTLLCLIGISVAVFLTFLNREQKRKTLLQLLLEVETFRQKATEPDGKKRKEALQDLSARLLYTNSFHLEMLLLRTADYAKLVGKEPSQEEMLLAADALTKMLNNLL
jgi:hypothetical protein